MLTNNGKKILQTLAFPQMINISQVTNMPIVDITGTTKYLIIPSIGLSSTYSFFFPEKVVVGYPGSNDLSIIKFYNNSNPIDANDYAEPSGGVLNVTVTPITWFFTKNFPESCIYKAEFGINNVTQNSVTINKVAWLKKFSASRNVDSTNVTNEWFLMDETILASSLTIPPGESGTIDYIFNMDAMYNEAATGRGFSDAESLNIPISNLSSTASGQII